MTEISSMYVLSLLIFLLFLLSKGVTSVRECLVAMTVAYIMYVTVTLNCTLILYLVCGKMS